MRALFGEPAFDVLVCFVAGMLAGIAYRAWRYHRRDLRELRGPVARLLERHFSEEAAAAEEYLRCNRCRTGSTAFPCTCGADCYSQLCNGWIARAARPAIACQYCAPVFDGGAACTCATPCGDGQCGALAWAAASNTEEFER